MPQKESKNAVRPIPPTATPTTPRGRTPRHERRALIFSEEKMDLMEFFFFIIPVNPLVLLVPLPPLIPQLKILSML